MLPHPQDKGLHAAHDEPRGVGTEHGPLRAYDGLQISEILASAGHASAQNIAVAVDVLRQTVRLVIGAIEKGL